MALASQHSSDRFKLFVVKFANEVGQAEAARVLNVSQAYISRIARDEVARIRDTTIESAERRLLLPRGFFDSDTEIPSHPSTLMGDLPSDADIRSIDVATAIVGGEIELTREVARDLLRSVDRDLQPLHTRLEELRGAVARLDGGDPAEQVAARIDTVADAHALALLLVELFG